MKCAVVEVVMWMHRVRKDINNAQAFDIAFFHLLFEALNLSEKEFEDIFQDTIIAGVLKKVSKACFEVDDKVVWWSVCRKMGNDGTHVGGVTQASGKKGTRAYKGVAAAFLSALSGLLETTTTDDMSKIFQISSQHSAALGSREALKNVDKAFSAN